MHPNSVNIANKKINQKFGRREPIVWIFLEMKRMSPRNWIVYKMTQYNTNHNESK
jgi:hypothetical protein